jgi:hypothetical protein
MKRTTWVGLALVFAVAAWFIVSSVSKPGRGGFVPDGESTQQALDAIAAVGLDKDRFSLVCALPVEGAAELRAITAVTADEQKRIKDLLSGATPGSYPGVGPTLGTETALYIFAPGALAIEVGTCAPPSDLSRRFAGV